MDTNINSALVGQKVTLRRFYPRRDRLVNNLENPQLACVDQILAIPTQVRKLPLSVRRITVDLSNTERVLIGLDLVLRNRHIP